MIAYILACFALMAVAGWLMWETERRDTREGLERLRPLVITLGAMAVVIGTGGLAWSYGHVARSMIIGATLGGVAWLLFLRFWIYR